MEIKLKGEYVSGEYDTKTMKLLCIPARGKRTFGKDEVATDVIAWHEMPQFKKEDKQWKL